MLKTHCRASSPAASGASQGSRHRACLAKTPPHRLFPPPPKSSCSAHGRYRKG